MKIVSSIIGLIILSSTIFAQNIPQSTLFSKVEIGSKSYYNIKMQNGISYKARVVSVDPQNVLLLLPNEESLSIRPGEILEIKKQAHNSPGSIGLGFGIPYGFLGANLDIKVVNVIYLTAGIGTALVITPWYNIGMKCFLRSGEYKFRPMIMASYAASGLLYLQDYNGNVIEKQSYNSVCLSGGFQWALNISKTWGFDVGVVYIVDDSELENRKSELINQGYDFSVNATGNIKFSTGLRYIF